MTRYLPARHYRWFGMSAVALAGLCGWLGTELHVAYVPAGLFLLTAGLLFSMAFGARNSCPWVWDEGGCAGGPVRLARHRTACCLCARRAVSAHRRIAILDGFPSGHRDSRGLRLHWRPNHPLDGHPAAGPHRLDFASDHPHHTVRRFTRLVDLSRRPG